jgi:hypothetical protein
LQLDIFQYSFVGCEIIAQGQVGVFYFQPFVGAVEYVGKTVFREFRQRSLEIAAVFVAYGFNLAEYY